MDHDGSLQAWKGVGGTTPVSSEVQPCEVECISVSDNDGYLWIQDWDKVNAHEEQDRLTVAWVKPHTSAMKKAQMTQQEWQIATADDQADELFQGGAALDGTEVAEQVSKEADNKAQHMPQESKPRLFIVKWKIWWYGSDH